MTEYAHEKEQIETLKKWWEDNGKAIIIGAVLGITGLVGWQTWQQYQRNIAESASAEFAQLLKELDSGDKAAIRQRGDHIIARLGGSAYTDAAALALAKTAFGDGDAALAKTYLQRVIDNAKLPEFGYIARLRLARVLMDEQQYDAALTTLEIVVPDVYTSFYDELKGDIYRARGDDELARTAYVRAQAQADPDIPRQQLQLKLDDLGSVEPH